MVNDICGFADPEMPRVCEDHDVAVAKMASPPDLERPGAVERVDDIYDALSMNGFTDKTIIDPAFGGWSEAKTLEDDRETFRRLREFRGHGRPILVSINRKNFLRDLAGRDTERALPVSLAATAMAVERGAHVVRTHDVAETRDAALVGDAFTPGRVRDEAVGVEELDARTPAEVRRHLDRLGAPAGVDHAARASTRVFELSGLTERDRAELTAPPAGAGFAPGAADGSGLLYGTPAALRSLAREVDGSGRLRAALERIGDALADIEE
jgi:dihydropteroate synthase